jgi:hypothetical protein
MIQEDIMITAGIPYLAQVAVSQAEVRLVADQTSKAATTVIDEDKQILSNVQLLESEQASALVDVSV